MSTISVPQPRKSGSVPPKAQNKSPRDGRTYLTKAQHAELVRGHIPKGVHWGEVKLSRKQKGLRKKALNRQALRLAKI